MGALRLRRDSPSRLESLRGQKAQGALVGTRAPDPWRVQVKERRLLWVPLWSPKLSTERKTHSARAVGFSFMAGPYYIWTIAQETATQ